MKEIDPGSGTFDCPSCGKNIEPMEAYLILVKNNTEPPEQVTYRFDGRRCLSTFLARKDIGITLQGDIGITLQGESSRYRSQQVYVCQFCGYEGTGWKDGGDECPKCGKRYDWLLAQDSEE